MICRWVIVASLACLAVAVQADEPTLEQRHAECVAQFVDQLEALATKCDELALAGPAAQTRAWLTPRKSGRTTFFISEQGISKPPAGAETRIKQWHARFMALREVHAAKVYDLAAEAAGSQQGELALRLIYEVLHENPEHASAQRILGLKRKVMRVGKVRAIPGVHPNFGWKSGQHWSYDTAHFSLESNAGAKACLDAGRELEQLHDVWLQVFYPLWGQDRLVAARFDNQDVDLMETSRCRVVLFKDRDEYKKQLGKAGVAAAISSGFYSDEQKIALFYTGQDAKKSTWYHEATHQLIQEYLNAPAGVANDHNVWVVEGAALAMESLAFGDGFAYFGGYDADNLQFARFRARGGDFQMPLAELSSLGRTALQEHRDIRKIYGQMGGLGQFFMEGEEGQLRLPFLKTLLAVYRGQAKRGTLAEACETTYDPLDRRYYDYLDVTDAMVSRTPPLPGIRGLSLRKTSVTDAGLAAFRDCNQLQFLDLSLTTTGNAGFTALPASKALKTLFLEGTKITDVALAHVVRFTELEELYLSDTSISDEGIANLVQLKKLKVLDVSGCPLTDACLPSLAVLKQLDTLDTSRTKITSAGLVKLKQSPPKLKN